MLLAKATLPVAPCYWRATLEQRLTQQACSHTRLLR
jgi:hypothetical protein